MAARERALEGDVGKVKIGAKHTVDGTVSHGLISYYASTHFTGLAKGTQDVRRAELERFRSGYGDWRVATMHTTAMQTSSTRRRRQRSATLKAMRGLFCLGKLRNGQGVEASKSP
jgi:hypothetical protein